MPTLILEQKFSELVELEEEVVEHEGSLKELIDVENSLLQDTHLGIIHHISAHTLIQGTLSLIHHQAFERSENLTKFDISFLDKEASSDSIFLPISSIHVQPFEGTLNETDYFLKTFSYNDVIMPTNKTHFEVVHGHSLCPVVTFFPFHLMLRYSSLAPHLHNIFMSRMLRSPV